MANPAPRHILKTVSKATSCLALAVRIDYCSGSSHPPQMGACVWCDVDAARHGRREQRAGCHRIRLQFGQHPRAQGRHWTRTPGRRLPPSRGWAGRLRRTRSGRSDSANDGAGPVGYRGGASGYQQQQQARYDRADEDFPEYDDSSISSRNSQLSTGRGRPGGGGAWANGNGSPSSSGAAG